MPRQSKPKAVVSSIYTPSDIGPKELPLKVQWRPLNPTETYKRNRPDIETIIESHNLPVSPLSGGAEWHVTAYRDVNIRKSSFIKASKSKVQEIWSEEDRITATYELRGYRYTTGYFYIGLLGQSYAMAGMSNPYVKYRRLSDNTSIDVAKLSMIDGILMVEELRGLTQIPSGMYDGLHEFLYTGIKEVIGYYNPLNPVLYNPVNYPFLFPLLPSRDSILDVMHTAGVYVLPGYSIYIERNPDNGFWGIYQKSLDCKQYIKDWFNTHPLTHNLKRANIPGTRKLERVKDARDRKHSKGKRKKA